MSTTTDSTFCALIAVGIAAWIWAITVGPLKEQPALNQSQQAVELCEQTGGQIRVVRYTQEKGLELNCIYGDELYYDEATGTITQPVGRT